LRWIRHLVDEEARHLNVQQEFRAKPGRDAGNPSLPSGSANARLGNTIDTPEGASANAVVRAAAVRRLAVWSEIDRMMESINDMAQSIEGLVVDHRYDINVIVQDLRATAADLRTLSAPLKGADRNTVAAAHGACLGA
jgi:hypothetical protein